MSDNGDVLRVKNNTEPKKLAGAIIKSLEQNDSSAALQAIGPAAVNQAVKGLAISREFAATIGWDLVCVPGFRDVDIEGEQRTAIRFYIEPYQRRISDRTITDEELLKVSGNTEKGYSVKMAGAIAGALGEATDHKIAIQGVGAAAVNNAVKAICIARGYKASQGHDVICVPGFTDIEINGEQRTAMRFYVEYR